MKAVSTGGFSGRILRSTLNAAVVRLRAPTGSRLKSMGDLRWIGEFSGEDDQRSASHAGRELAWITSLTSRMHSTMCWRICSVVKTSNL